MGIPAQAGTTDPFRQYSCQTPGTHIFPHEAPDNAPMPAPFSMPMFGCANHAPLPDDGREQYAIVTRDILLFHL